MLVVGDWPLPLVRGTAVPAECLLPSPWSTAGAVTTAVTQTFFYLLLKKKTGPIIKILQAPWLPPEE